MTAPDSFSASRLSNTRPMQRADLIRRLVSKLDREEAVIGGIGHSNFDLWGAGDRPLNFYMLGSMGLACPIAFGVALGQPKRQVFALEGDGSLLMELGCLATIAKHSPPNLTIIVLDNGAYEITGGQPTATAAGADLVEVARACGLRQSQWANDEAHFDKLVDQARNGPGPWLIGTKLDQQKPVRQTMRDPAQIRDRFMRGLGTKPKWGS
jgi:thiamine pyrophosphate-dependent acetolactate synthase large subunit-like protein